MQEWWEKNDVHLIQKERTVFSPVIGMQMSQNQTECLGFGEHRSADPFSSVFFFTFAYSL